MHNSNNERSRERDYSGADFTRPDPSEQTSIPLPVDKQIPHPVGLERDNSKQIMQRYSSEQALPTIIEDRSGERSATDRLSASSKQQSHKDGIAAEEPKNSGPIRRLNMSMFFDELASRLQTQMKNQMDNLNRSSASQKFKSFGQSKAESVNNLILSEMNAIELYIADIFDLRFEEHEPLVLDSYLLSPIQVYTTTRDSARDDTGASPIEYINIMDKAKRLKSSIIEEIQKIKQMKFKHLVQSLEAHVEKRSVESLEKVLNPKRVTFQGSKSLSALRSQQEEQVRSTSPSGWQGPGSASTVRVLSRLVETSEARTLEDSETINNMDGKLNDLLDRIDRL